MSITVFVFGHTFSFSVAYSKDEHKFSNNSTETSCDVVYTVLCSLIIFTILFFNFPVIISDYTAVLLVINIAYIYLFFPL